MNTLREARRDAKEYARAQMFYGEGAGTRRKLITASVESKAERNQTYARAFRTALQSQDMADHAKKAARERNLKDKTVAIKKNTNAILSGNYKNVQSTILILIIAGYVAHQTGLDQKILDKSKVVLADVKVRIKKYKDRRDIRVNPVD